MELGWWDIEMGKREKERRRRTDRPRPTNLETAMVI